MLVRARNGIRASHQIAQIPGGAGALLLFAVSLLAVGKRATDGRQKVGRLILRFRNLFLENRPGPVD